MPESSLAAKAVEDIAVELDAKPRRAKPRFEFAKRALAPVAVVSALGLLVAQGLGAGEQAATDLADPQVQVAAPQRVSRDTIREPIDPMPTSSMSAVKTASASSTPSPSAKPSASSTPTPSAKPSVAPAPKAPAKPAAPTSQLGKKIGLGYTTEKVNLRVGPGTNHKVISVLASGQKLELTDRKQDDWQQVNLEGEAGWLKTDLLSSKAPVAKPKPVPGGEAEGPDGEESKPEESKPSGAIFDTSPCSKVSRILGGLTPRTRQVAKTVCNKFDGVTGFGGYRNQRSGYHGKGRAIDIMVPSGYGWKIANWARANANALGVMEVIYERKIWTVRRAGQGWRYMADRGSVSANHLDHVHLSIR